MAAVGNHLRRCSRPKLVVPMQLHWQHQLP